MPCTPTPPHSRWIVAAPAPGPHATPTRARAGSKAAPRAPAAIQAIGLLRRLPDAVTLETPLEDTEGSSHRGSGGPGKIDMKAWGRESTNRPCLRCQSCLPMTPRVFLCPHFSLCLPTSPHVSLYLPITSRFWVQADDPSSYFLTTTFLSSRLCCDVTQSFQINPWA